MSENDKEEIRKGIETKIRAALKPLNAKQRKFCRFMAEGNTTQEGAVVNAGYAPKSARTRGWQLMRYEHIQNAIDVLSLKYEYEHGVSSGRKRALLMDVAETASEPGKNYQPSASVQAINQLNLMDGSHKPKQLSIAGEVTVKNLAYEFAFPNAVIEGELEPEKPELGCDNDDDN